MDQVIRELLRRPENKRLYGQRQVPVADGQVPLKKSGKTLPEDEKGTWANARKLHRSLIYRLGKYAKEDAAARKLLRVLDGCRPKRRCCNAACAKCNYAAQGLWAELMKDFMEGGIELDRCVTIIAPGRILPDNSEGEVVVERFRRKLDAAFDTANVSIMIGAFDFDCSEFPDGEFRDHSRPHIHGLGLSAECDPADSLIRKHFPNKNSINKPVEISSYDDRVNWLWYMLKIPNTRKIRRRADGSDEDSEIQAPSNYKSLRVEQHIQQALLLDRLGWLGRFYLRGVEIKKSPLGYWKLISLQKLIPRANPQ